MTEPLRLDTLDHDQLVVLAHEVLLAGHLIDRAGMPQVVSGLGQEAMTDIAIQEWMGASPIYTRRMQRLLGFAGNDDVATIFKGMQLDIGAPPQFMDFRFRVHDHDHGEFWLVHCGALMDVEPMGEDLVVAMCHDIEDPTFPATAWATNPRARMTPIHRPPRRPADRAPHCLWSVDIEAHHEPATKPPAAERVGATLAAQLPITPIGHVDGSIPSRADYTGPLAEVAPLTEFSAATLRAVIAEVALQGHLLVLSFYLVVAELTDPHTAADITRRQLMGVGGIVAERIRAAFDLGDDLVSIASVLNLHPAFLPQSYVKVAVTPGSDAGQLVVRLEDSPALHETVASPWPALIGDDPSALDAILWGINPTARSEVTRVPGPGTNWTITLGHDPAREPDPVMLTRFSTGAAFQFQYA